MQIGEFREVFWKFEQQKISWQLAPVMHAFDPVTILPVTHLFSDQQAVPSLTDDAVKIVL